MTKTIEEAAKQFTDELFAGDDLTDFDTQTEKNDAYVTCMAFGNHLMEQPLSVRLTAEEKERVRKIYAECELIEMDDSPNLPADRITEATAKIQVLESIFGKDFFKEGE